SSISRNDVNDIDQGGGIDARNGCNLVIKSSHVDGNSAGVGGGIFTTGTGADAVDLTVVQSKITGNTATHGSAGGGISATGDGKIILNHDQISGNSATFGGGGAYLSSTDSIAIISSVIANNGIPSTTSSDGAGLFLFGTAG